MRNMLAFLAAVVIALVGVGWYLDWFKFSVKPDADGHQNVIINVDTKKAEGDSSHFLSTAVKKGEQIIENEKSPAAKAAGAGPSIQSTEADGKNIEVKTKNLDVAVPVKDYQIPPR